LRRIEAHPKKAILHMLLLRSMQQAAYDVNNLGHFGLASAAYLHFTSPIRRYSDLVVHRVLRRMLRGQPIAEADSGASALTTKDLSIAALTASERERLTMAAERAISDLYRALYMRSHIGSSYVGMVVSIAATGVYVQIDDPFVTVMVPFDDLGPGGFEADDNGLRVRGVRSGEIIALGDEMMLTIADVSILRRAVYGRRTRSEAAVGESEPRRRGRAGKGKKAEAAVPDRPERGKKRKATRVTSQRASDARARVPKKRGKKKRR
jgi:ribonuclease R